MLIGITGKRNNGKDEVAKIIQRRFGFGVTAFALKLKQALKIMFCLTDEQLFGNAETKETIDPRWGLSPRALLQQIGTGIMRKTCPDVWIRGTFLEIENNPHPIGWIIVDCRFRNEEAAIRNHGGIIIKVVRPTKYLTLWQKIVSWFKSSGKFSRHISEREIDKIKPDYVIDNDRSLGHLEDKVVRLLIGLGIGEKIPYGF